MLNFKPFSYRAALSLWLLALAASNAYAARSIPNLTSPVVDEARLFTPQQGAYLQALLQKLYVETATQIAVLSIPSLEGDALETYSLRVAESWELGRAESDRGLLLLIVAEDKKIRIEVGQGLEGEVPDALASRLIRQVLSPAFRQQRYFEGVSQSLDFLIGKLHPDFSFSGARPPNRPPKKDSNGLGFLFLILIAIVMSFDRRGRFDPSFLLLFLLNSGGGRGGRGGGGFSGGGGGGFSGGGASGGW